jgi:hypothetical protein
VSKFILKNGHVYRRRIVTALEAPKPQELGGPLRNAFLERKKVISLDIEMLQKIYGFLQKHLEINPSLIAKRLQKAFSKSSTKSMLQNYSAPQSVEAWVEYPSSFGMSLVDLSNQLPPELVKIEKRENRVIGMIEELEKLAKDIPDPELVSFIKEATDALARAIFGE